MTRQTNQSETNAGQPLSHMLSVTCSKQLDDYTKAKTGEILSLNNTTAHLRKEVEAYEQEIYKLEMRKDYVMHAACQKTSEHGQVTCLSFTFD